jgi:RNA-splicing ligase RtcB
MQRIKGDNVDILAWASPDEIGEKALAQLRNTAGLPWAFHHVAAMPDVHFGKGATVGSVIAMKGAVAPAAVGVDIGCGMAAIRTSLTASDLPDDLRKIRSDVERAIPVGFGEHKQPLDRPEDKALLGEFEELTPAVRDLFGKARRQLGSLGGGNHFIELCLDTEERVWMMLHSGSRGIGNKLAVRGLGNPQSFESASHGAGRRMSRGEARRKLTVEDLREQTRGVECRKDAGVIDEAPGAYKPIEKVMEAQRDLVEIAAELRQVLCVKG